MFTPGDRLGKMGDIYFGERILFRKRDKSNRGGISFMPRVGITAYDLLISCPGDVNQFTDIIRECVGNFNRVYGNINNMEINVITDFFCLFIFFPFSSFFLIIF